MNCWSVQLFWKFEGDHCHFASWLSEAKLRNYLGNYAHWDNEGNQTKHFLAHQKADFTSPRAFDIPVSFTQANIYRNIQQICIATWWFHNAFLMSSVGDQIFMRLQEIYHCHVNQSAKEMVSLPFIFLHFFPLHPTHSCPQGQSEVW